MRILITGRRADVRSALGNFLRNKLDLDEVVEAANIQTMLTQSESTQPDIILLDWDSCDRPLEDLIPALHMLESRPGVVLINETYKTKKAALDAGVDAVVLRGDPPKSLLIAIESVRLEREGN